MSLPDALKQTIQVLPDATEQSRLELFAYVKRGPLLSSWGTRQRERELFYLYHHDYNWMVQGAFAGIAKRIASTPWEITGPDDTSGKTLDYYRSMAKAANLTLGSDNPADIEYWQQVLRQADMGRGWGSFVKKLVVDFLRYDGGAYIEITAPGNPLRAPTGAATGLMNLDGLRCYPTGDPEYPAIYWNRNNKPHLLHTTRMVQVVDMPETFEEAPGYGLSALSRAVSIAQRELLMGRYIEAMLDDKPPPGIVVAAGMVRAERDRAVAAFNEEQRLDQQPPWGRQLWFYSADVNAGASITATSFTQAPEAFNFVNYTELDVDALALALGVDRQEIWQLTGGNLGSGAQSEILHQKARGKTIGDLMATLERSINDVLPEEYTFEFKRRDAQEDAETAANAKAWADVIATLGPRLSDEEARQLLANEVEPLHEVVTNEAGQVTVIDTDVQPPPVGEVQNGPPQEQPGQPDGEASVDETDGGPAADGMGAARSGRRDIHLGESIKALDTIARDFTNDWRYIVEKALAREIDPVRFGIEARETLRQYGREALLQGLADGGVTTSDVPSEDFPALVAWLVQESSFVPGLTARIYAPVSTVDAGMTAQLWANKSLRAAYQLGRVSADRNGMYEWVLGATEEHCRTCLRMNGQRHRLNTWHRRGLLPGSQQLECKGFNCDCRFVKTTERARGRF